MQGLDEELELEAREGVASSDVVEEKPKRKPFHFWSVGGVDHRMKLNTSMITKLENKYRSNIVTLVADGDMPPLSVMLTIAQAAIAPWEHKVSYNDIEKMYDKYLEEGGNMVSFYETVIIPTMAVSGFFTDSMVESILANLKDAEMLA